METEIKEVAPAIITLREGINIGSGITKMLEVADYDFAMDEQMVFYKVQDGFGYIPMKNIAGIYPKKQISDNEA
jgi:hypothetical protein